MILKPGVYFIGDPGFVLPVDDLRMLFAKIMDGHLTSGLHELVSSTRLENGRLISDSYWVAVMPHRSGTLYDQNGKCWSFDWKCFGVVPWEWIDKKESSTSGKFDFSEPFECLATDDSVTIGQLYLTLHPQ